MPIGLRHEAEVRQLVLLPCDHRYSTGFSSGAPEHRRQELQPDTPRHWRTKVPDQTTTGSKNRGAAGDPAG